MTCLCFNWTTSTSWVRVTRTNRRQTHDARGLILIVSCEGRTGGAVIYNFIASCSAFLDTLLFLSSSLSRLHVFWLVFGLRESASRPIRIEKFLIETRRSTRHLSNCLASIAANEEKSSSCDRPWKQADCSRVQAQAVSPSPESFVLCFCCANPTPTQNDWRPRHASPELKPKRPPRLRRTPKFVHTRHKIWWVPALREIFSHPSHLMTNFM